MNDDDDDDHDDDDNNNNNDGKRPDGLSHFPSFPGKTARRFAGM